jgi:dipeptidyl aminopeptidase/acylaminoacyl peptidase
MNLDEELRAVLETQADRCVVPPPDLEGLRAGGLRRRRHRRGVNLVAMTGAVVLALVGGTAIWNTQTEDRSIGVTDTPEPPRGAEALHFYDIGTGDRSPAQGYASDAEYRFSPDGSRVACSGSCFGTTRPLVVADSDDGDLVELHVPPGVDNEGQPFDALPAGIRWSPDGSQLVYTLVAGLQYSNIQDLYVHDIATDETSRIVDFGLQERAFYHLGGLDVSPDGGTVVYSRPRMPAPCPEPYPQSPCTEPTDFDLWSVPITGGEPTLVLRDAGEPGYLADGQRIAFVEVGHAYFDGASIVVYANGTRQTLAANPRANEMQMSPDRSKSLFVTTSGITIVDVATGDTSPLYGNTAAWVGDDRLLIGCIPRSSAPGEEPTVDTCSP